MRNLVNVLNGPFARITCMLQAKLHDVAAKSSSKALMTQLMALLILR